MPRDFVTLVPPKPIFDFHRVKMFVSDAKAIAGKRAWAKLPPKMREAMVDAAVTRALAGVISRDKFTAAQIRAFRHAMMVEAGLR